MHRRGDPSTYEPGPLFDVLSDIPESKPFSGRAKVFLGFSLLADTPAAARGSSYFRIISEVDRHPVEVASRTETKGGCRFGYSPRVEITVGV
nr:hypothetical protein CFP56_74673 [Quercus suber]